MARFTSRSRGRDPYLRAIAKATRKGGFFAGFARRWAAGQDRQSMPKGDFMPPGAGGRVPPHFLFYGACWGRFRAPARGPFGTAQKGRKGRLGAAAPKDPFDVQYRACVSYRRVGVVLPLRPLPGLRPYCVGIQAAPPPDTAPGAVGITGAPAPFLRSPPHPKGTSSALRASQRTMNGKRSREATILLS